MVETDFSGNFANYENCLDSDVIEIIGEGAYEGKINQKGQKYSVLNVPIRNGQKELIWTPSRDSGIRFRDKHGKNTSSWVGKKGQVKHLLKQVFGVTKTYIEIFPID